MANDITPSPPKGERAGLRGAMGLCVLCFVLPATATVADDSAEVAAAARSAITAEGLQEQAEAIVQYERPSGSPGENAAIDHIVRTLRADGITVDVHTFQAYTSDPVSASAGVVETSFTAEAITAAYSGAAAGLEAPLVAVGTVQPTFDAATGEKLALSSRPAETIAAELDRSALAGAEKSDASFPDVAGKIAVVDGLPFPDAAWQLEELGAVGAIFVNPVEDRLNELIISTIWGTPSTLNAHRIPKLPVAQVRKADGVALLAAAADGATGRLNAEVKQGWRPLRLAIAKIEAPGDDPPLAVLGGHIDAWYHGANDEGASNAAMVEIARAFHASRAKLRRSLWVAWWPGHSNGRYAGSAWFADHYFGTLRRRGVAYLNIDGVGQKDAKVFSATVTRSLDALARRVVADRAGAADIETGLPGRNSDQAFNGIGLPILQFNHRRLEEDGGYWWWHTPHDTIDKVDSKLLEVAAELYSDALSVLLAAPRLPIDVSAEVAGLGDAIEAAATLAGDELDLDEARALVERLAELTAQLDASTAPGDLELVRVLRPLHRVSFTLAGPYHPDVAVSVGQLPGLSSLAVLTDPARSADERGFARATLIRERNRLVAALDEAIEAASGVVASRKP